MSRAVEQKQSSEGIVKPGELIDVRKSADLTLHDRRVLNLLIENAWTEIEDNTLHVMPLRKLRGPTHKGGERVSDSVGRLITTLVEIPTKDKNSKPATLRTSLLSETTTTDDEDDPKAYIRYAFSQGMRDIIKNSRYWGRIKAHVMFSFSSKYALCLYEALCLRGNLQVSEQEFSVENFRDLLGVPNEKLERSPDLLRRVVNPAAEEVNGLSDFNVEIEPIRDGGMVRGKVVGFRMSWEKKSREDWLDVLDELSRPKLGRKARLRGTVETAAPRR